MSSVSGLTKSHAVIIVIRDNLRDIARLRYIFVNSVNPRIGFITNTKKSKYWDETKLS